MDEITLGGKNYISSKRAAEITGYTKDYVGQLARNNKILATRFGRAWYVGEEAIKRHAGLLIEENQTNATHAVVPEEILAKEPEVRPPEENEKNIKKPIILPSAVNEKRLSLNAIRIQSLQTEPKKSLLGTWRDIRYLPDDSYIFPEIPKRTDKPSISAVGDTTTPVVMSRGTPTIHRIVAAAPRAIPVEHNTKGDGTGIIKSIDGITKKNKPLGSVSRYNEMNMQRHRKQQAPRIEGLVYAGAYAVAFLVAGITASTLFPSEWAFSERPFLVANSGALGESYSLILEYFINIIAEGIALIALFISTFLASLGEFFDIGLEFIRNLFNLG